MLVIAVSLVPADWCGMLVIVSESGTSWVMWNASDCQWVWYQLTDVECKWLSVSLVPADWCGMQVIVSESGTSWLMWNASDLSVSLVPAEWCGMLVIGDSVFDSELVMCCNTCCSTCWTQHFNQSRSVRWRLHPNCHERTMAQHTCLVQFCTLIVLVHTRRSALYSIVLS